VTDIWPTELRIRENGRTLVMTLESGVQHVIPAEILRVESPSAEVKGHGPGQEVLVAGKRNVLIMRAEPVGNYAVRLHFNDGHDTGIFTWGYLAKLGSDHCNIMASYTEKLTAAGLSR
jgi:DUF971 family protein